jgi:hypothetical protein
VRTRLVIALVLLTLTACGSSQRSSVRRPAKPIRKEVYRLTVADLRRTPVWYFPFDESDGNDEGIVEARPKAQVVDPHDGMFAVRARFVAHDGRRYEGYFTPSFSDAISDTQPTIVVGGTQIGFWFGIAPPRRAQIRRSYRTLSTDAPHLFPLRYASAVRTAGGPSSGVVRGFGYYGRAQRARFTR